MSVDDLRGDLAEAQTDLKLLASIATDQPAAAERDVGGDAPDRVAMLSPEARAMLRRAHVSSHSSGGSSLLIGAVCAITGFWLGAWLVRGRKA